MNNNERLISLITLIRLDLYNNGKNCGANVIKEKLKDYRILPQPSIYKINKILKDKCLTNGRTGFYEEDFLKFGKNDLLS